MDLWIEKVCEPSRLLLCWEAPVTQRDRNRWVVGTIESRSEAVIFRYLTDDEFLTLNFKRTRQQLRDAGYLGYPAFNEERSDVFLQAVLETFIRRLPPRGRPDFPDYLAQFWLRPDSATSDLALLGATEARLPSDGFSLINPLEAGSGPCEVLVEIAGHRHYEGALLKIGDALTLVPDPENPYDANAIRFDVDGALAGHVSRVQAPTVLAWLSRGSVSAQVARLNGAPDRPKAFALLRYQPASECVAA